MVECPRCGTKVDETGYACCPQCGARLPSDSMEQHDERQPEVEPSRRAMWRVWTSLAVFGILLAAFVALADWAHWAESVRREVKNQPVAETQDVPRASRDTQRVPLDTRRVLLVVSEQIDGKERVDKQLMGLLRETLETAGFDPIESSAGSRVREQALSAESASYMTCSVRASSREEAGTGRVHVSLSADIRVYQSAPFRMLFARKESSRAAGTTLDDAFRAAHDKVTRPLIEQAVSRLAAVMLPDSEGDPGGADTTGGRDRSD